MDKKTFRPLIVPLLMMAIAASAVLLLSEALRRDHEQRVADIVEAVSYGARSEIARQLIVQFRAFEHVREFWSEFAPVPVEQWRADAMIEIDHFDGLEVLAWAEAEGPRFFTSGPAIALNHTPTDAEWAMIQSSVDAAWEAEGDVVIDPFVDEDGHAVVRLYLPARVDGRDAVLIAIIDTTEQIAALLQDESPGYDILVSCCDGVEIYRDGDFQADVPESWVHGGLIEPREGMFWRMQHRPSVDLAEDFRPWAMNFVLIVGLALALAIGAIAYHSRRADERARAAVAAEQEIRALNEILESRVDERTWKLNEALSDLNTINLSVAHDVRSPLNSASLMLESIEPVLTADAGTADKASRIRAALERISFILDRLRVLSRAAVFELEVERVDMADLARQVVSEHEAADEIDAAIGEMPPAAMDRTMAHVLLTNLIGNAVEHSIPNGRIRVEAGFDADAIVPAYFVRDHGVGIAPEQRNEVFKPGRRGNGQTGEGRGLGLAIISRIVARHGGEIWVEDTEGGGATFFFTVSNLAD